jgi:transposase
MDALKTGDRRMPDAMHSVSGFDRIEVVTGVERRRRWSLGEKLKAVEETRSSGMSVFVCGAKIWYCSQLVISLEKAHGRGRQGSNS